MTDKNTYDQVRRAARRVGLIAKKSRSRGGYALLDQQTGACVAGSWFELSAEGALAWIERRSSKESDETFNHVDPTANAQVRA